MFGFISDALTDIWQGAEDAITDVWQGAEDTLTDVWQGAEDTATDAFRTGIEPVATAVGAYYGGPIGAGIGNTVGGLLRGEDFDEAVSGGVTSGVTSYAGNALLGGSSGSGAGSSDSGSFWDAIDFGDTARGIAGTAINAWAQSEFGVNPTDLTNTVTNSRDNLVIANDLFSEDSMRLLVQKLVADNELLASRSNSASDSAGRQAVNEELLNKMPGLNKLIAGTGMYNDNVQGQLRNKVATDARTAGNVAAAKMEADYANLINRNSELIARLSSAVIGENRVGDGSLVTNNTYRERR